MNDAVRNDGLAEKIRRYWHKQGYPGIRVNVVAMREQRVSSSGAEYTGKYLAITSNLGPNGLPPREGA